MDPSLIKTGIFNHCRRFRCVAFCNNNIIWWTQITKLNISEIKLRNSSIASLIFCVWHLFFGRKYSSETPVLLWTKRYTVKKRLKTPENDFWFNQSWENKTPSCLETFWNFIVKYTYNYKSEHGLRSRQK